MSSVIFTSDSTIFSFGGNLIILFECAVAAARRNSPNFSQDVFVIAYSQNNSPADVTLLGTAFSVNSISVLTANHVIWDDDNETFLANVFYIGSDVIKNGELNEILNYREVNLSHRDIEKDWALLTLTNDPHFTRWLPICATDDLPTTDEHEELKCYYAPIGQYLRNSLENMSIWSDPYKRVLQYNLDRSKIICDGGLYRGSCGAPYINRSGHVVAMHLSSMNEGVEFSNVKHKKRRTIQDLEERVAGSVTDLNDVHNSIREGLVLRNVTRLFQLIDLNLR